MLTTLLIVCLCPSATVRPDGLDSHAIAAAIDRASPGDTVRLATGTYVLTEPVRPTSGLKVLGAGPGKTRLVYVGRKRAVLVQVQDCHDVEIGEMTLDGNSDPLIGQGIAGSNARRLWIHHVTIRDLVPSPKTFGPHGILLSGVNPTMRRGVTDSRISDCLIENIGVGAKFGGGVRLNWGCVRNVIERLVIRKTGRGGIFGDHSAELVIRKNRVSGSGGTGLGIEIWGGCPRSVIEDNVIDHWLSVDNSPVSAVRRNVIGTDDGTVKGYGIEVIARDVVVTDNVVTRGAHIGLSLSNKPVKNNVYWGYNRVRDCIQWGAQFQGETGGIARQYFYRCVFEKTVRGDSHARYPRDSGHGFRTNGACRELVFEQCTVRDNGGLGFQFGGKGIEAIALLRCTISGNALAAISPPSPPGVLQIAGCTVRGNGSDRLPAPRRRPGAGPVADFDGPKTIRAGQPVTFRCTSKPGAAKIVERLWDFNHGIPATAEAPSHTFAKAGNYRATLIVWDAAGRGARAEKTLTVLPAK